VRADHPINTELIFMLKETKQMLAQIRGAQKAAATLLNDGEKVGNIFTRLRAAGDEAEARVKHFERSVFKSAPAPKPEKAEA
jgi:hypothetical protein